MKDMNTEIYANFNKLMEDNKREIKRIEQQLSEEEDPKKRIELIDKSMALIKQTVEAHDKCRKEALNSLIEEKEEVIKKFKQMLPWNKGSK